MSAAIGLGANVGDAYRTLAAAIAALAALPDVRVLGVSGLYRTRPVGVLDQPDFLNAAALLDVPAGADPEPGALALLEALKGIEQAFGRRVGRRWGPRPLDLDLLLFGPHRIHVERTRPSRSADPSRVAASQWLDVPHGSARERLFVLAPLAELAPNLTPPGWDETVEQARARQERTEGADAVERLGSWDSAGGGWWSSG